MKKLKCPDCDKFFEGESAEELMNNMHPHYMTDHKDIMEATKEEDKEVWMKKFNEDFDAAEEI